MNQEWIVAIIVIVAIAASAVAAVVVLLNHYDRQGNLEQSQYGKWNVELWSIQYGFRVDLEFQNSMVLGRYTLYNTEVQMQQIEVDNCISREHVLLYDQGGMLWAWNMSAVNPAMINGHRLNSTQRIIPGIRLELGNSVFLVTRVDFTAFNKAL